LLYEDISKMWLQDCEIDITKLDQEALNISKLHHKYYLIYSQETIKLHDLKADYNKFVSARFNLLMYGTHDKDELPIYRQLNPKSTKLKPEVERILEGSEEYIEKNRKIAVQSEKVDFLKEIIKNINSRNFHIKEANSFLRFKNGLS
jgi:hypothetical protein